MREEAVISMKKHTKTLILALACLILLCCTLAIAVSADTEPSVSIVRKNISYDDAPRILYAVDAKNVNDGDSVKILFSSSQISAPAVGEALVASSEDEYIKSAVEEKIPVGGTEYYAVFSNGTAPADMRVPVYAIPVIVNADNIVLATGECVEYNVFTYVTNMLKRGASPEQKLLFTTLLDMGAAVQRVLIDSENASAIENADKFGYADEYYDFLAYRGQGNYASLAQTFTGLAALPTSPYKITSVDGGLKGNVGDANWTAIIDNAKDAYLDIGRNGGTTGSSPLFWFTKTTGAEKYVFETDIKWGGCDAASGAYPIYIKFSDGASTVTLATMYVNENGDLYTNKNGINATFIKDIWCNLRIEITYVSDNEATFAWYLNGTAVGTSTFVCNAKNSNWLQFEIRSNQSCAGNDVFNISFDNVYSATCKEDYRGKGDYSSLSQSFTGISALPTSPYKITSVDGGLKGKVGDANWTAIIDNATNAYLDIGRNGGTSGSSPLFWFAKTAGTEKYVLETDFKWGGSNAAAWTNPMSIIFNDGKNSLTYKMFTNALGELWTNQNGVNATFTAGFWYNLRVEISYVSDTEATFAWYVNGKAVGTTSATFNAKNATWVQFQVQTTNSCPGNDVFNISFDNVYTATKHENYRGKGEYVSSAIDFTGRTSLPTVPYKISSVDGGLNGNVGDAKWTAIVDSSTDAYLDIGRNGGTSGSSPLFWFAKTEGAEKYVFETDIKWGGSNAAAWQNPVNIIFNDGTNNLTYKMFTNAIGELYTEQNGVNVKLSTEFWYNLRVEITYVSDTEATVAWYVNGEAVGTTSAAFNAKNATWVQFQVQTTNSCKGNDVFNISFDNVYVSTAKD